MKYRKKPVVIEAITFHELVEYGLIHCGANQQRGMPWSFDYVVSYEDANGERITKSHPITHENDDTYLIPTLEGTMQMGRSDMLITGVKGEIYPCKLDIFEATYVLVEKQCHPNPEAWGGKGGL